MARLIGGPSELLSSVELSREEAGGVSPSCSRFLHVRAAGFRAEDRPSRALPASSLRWPFSRSPAPAWSGCSRPPSPRATSPTAIARLWRGDSGAPPVAQPDRGRLSITYLYPAYTGLPPRTEEGTAGDLRAPRGTEVRLDAHGRIAICPRPSRWSTGRR